MDIIRKIFADSSGNIVIGQKPNLPIVVWAASKLLQLLPLSVLWNELLSLVAFGALFTWAWLEMFQGSCLFRRLLGIAVMGLLLYFSL